MTIANLGRQHHRSLDSYFKSSWEDLYSFGVLSYYFILVSILLKLVVYVFKLVLYYLCFRIPSIIRQLYVVCHIDEKTTPRSYDFLCVTQTCHTNLQQLQVAIDHFVQAPQVKSLLKSLLVSLSLKTFSFWVYSHFIEECLGSTLVLHFFILEVEGAC